MNQGTKEDMRKALLSPAAKPPREDGRPSSMVIKVWTQFIPKISYNIVEINKTFELPSNALLWVGFFGVLSKLFFGIFKLKTVDFEPLYVSDMNSFVCYETERQNSNSCSYSSRSYINTPWS